MKRLGDRLLNAKRWSLVCILLLACVAPNSANGEDAPAAGDSRFGFTVGEELIYRVYWGFIPVGKTRIVSSWIEEDGRRLLAIRYRTRSNRFIAALYPVDDLIESIIDPDTFLPVRFVKKLKEGHRRNDEITTFDFEKGEARWQDFIKNRSKTYPIDPDTRDIVSFMYFMRSHRFKPGDKKKFRVMADEKIYDLFVSAEEVEDVKLKRFGRVKSIRLEPEAQFEGLFVRKGKVTVWVSEDERGLLSKMVGSVPVASIKVIPWEVHGPGDDFWIRKTKEASLGDKGDKQDPDVEKALRELDEDPMSPW